MNMVLVAGGSGFIGTVLCRALSEMRVPVRVLDLRPPIAEKVEYMRGSVLNLNMCKRAVTDCDIVFNLASPVGVAVTERSPQLTTDVNVVGTENLLQACWKSSAFFRIVQASSSEVYGEPERTPISESDRCTPISVYGRAKLDAEILVRKRWGGAVARLFNVYGPRQSTDFVIPSFVHKALHRLPLAVYGDGTQIRAFCHVDDAVRGLIAIATHHDATNKVFNIGDPREPISMLELAHKVVSLTKSCSEVTLEPYSASTRERSREVFARVPAVGKAWDVLRFAPRVGLDEGIAQIAEGMRSDS